MKGNEKVQISLFIAYLTSFFSIRTKKLFNCLKMEIVTIKTMIVASFKTGYNAPFINSEHTTGAGEWIGMAIGVMISVLMLPPVADTVMGVNVSAWNFTGSQACITLMYLIPMVYIAGVLVKIVKTALGK